MARVQHNSWRQLAAELSLLAIVVYSTLVPWHMAARSLQATADTAAAFALCHGGDFADIAIASPPIDPSPAVTDCPVCKGLAAISFALPPVAPGLAVEPDGHGVWAAERAVAHVVPVAGAPRNRGPPRPA